MEFGLCLRQFLVIDNFAVLFNRTPVDRASNNDGPDLKLFILVSWNRGSSSVAWNRGSTDDLLFLQISSGVV